jgi:hypothetical protein
MVSTRRRSAAEKKSKKEESKEDVKNDSDVHVEQEGDEPSTSRILESKRTQRNNAKRGHNELLRSKPTGVGLSIPPPNAVKNKKIVFDDEILLPNAETTPAVEQENSSSDDDVKESVKDDKRGYRNASSAGTGTARTGDGAVVTYYYKQKAQNES